MVKWEWNLAFLPTDGGTLERHCSAGAWRFFGGCSSRTHLMISKSMHFAVEGCAPTCSQVSPKNGARLSMDRKSWSCFRGERCLIHYKRDPALRSSRCIPHLIKSSH